MILKDGTRKYPIENEAHARNALARVAQHGNPEEKAEVRKKVHERYPSIGIDDPPYKGDSLYTVVAKKNGKIEQFPANNEEAAKRIGYNLVGQGYERPIVFKNH